MAMTDPSFSLFKELGVTMRNKYFDHSGKFLREFTITRDMYWLNDK